MSAPSADAFIEGAAKEQIAALAILYDRFAHSLDPFSQARDEAEMAFTRDLAEWYDCMLQPKPPFHEFRKAVILRCRRHLAATNRPSSP